MSIYHPGTSESERITPSKRVATQLASLLQRPDSVTVLRDPRVVAATRNLAMAALNFLEQKTAPKPGTTPGTMHEFVGRVQRILSGGKFDEVCIGQFNVDPFENNGLEPAHIFYIGATVSNRPSEPPIGVGFDLQTGEIECVICGDCSQFNRRAKFHTERSPALASTGFTSEYPPELADAITQLSTALPEPQS